MATDAVIYPTSPVRVQAPVARPAVRKVQSFQGMTATKVINGTDRDRVSAAERMQARAPEMELIREAQGGSRAAFDALVRQYEQ